MNKRIRELMAEADRKCSETRGVYDEILAELIVKECADICNKIYFDRYPDAEDFERSEEGDAIKQHFGVEE
jgi:transcription initiation factor TFIIIB Brf1 subunit/transcription initiation factor TFIIB